MVTISNDPCDDFNDFVRVRGLKQWQYHYLCRLFLLKEDRAAMAALRRGLGGEADEVQQLPMARYIYGVLQVPTSPKLITPREERAVFLVASLFAAYIRSDRPLIVHLAQWGDMGKHFFSLWAEQPDDSLQRQSIERRFDLLLASHSEELAVQLRKALSFLRSQSEHPIPIQWAQLLYDFTYWDEVTEERDRELVRYRWAKNFWGSIGNYSRKISKH